MQAGGYQQLGEFAALQGNVERFAASFARAIELLDRAELPERRVEALDRLLTGAFVTSAPHARPAPDLNPSLAAVPGA